MQTTWWSSKLKLSVRALKASSIWYILSCYSCGSTRGFSSTKDASSSTLSKRLSRPRGWKHWEKRAGFRLCLLFWGFRARKKLPSQCHRLFGAVHWWHDWALLLQPKEGSRLLEAAEGARFPVVDMREDFQDAAHVHLPIVLCFSRFQLIGCTEFSLDALSFQPNKERLIAEICRGSSSWRCVREQMLCLCTCLGCSSEVGDFSPSVDGYTWRRETLRRFPPPWWEAQGSLPGGLSQRAQEHHSALSLSLGPFSLLEPLAGDVRHLDLSWSASGLERWGPTQRDSLRFS